jgi:hypothetical protein
MKRVGWDCGLLVRSCKLKAFFKKKGALIPYDKDPHVVLGMQKLSEIQRLSLFQGGGCSIHNYLLEVKGTRTAKNIKRRKKCEVDENSPTKA